MQSFIVGGYLKHEGWAIPRAKSAVQIWCQYPTEVPWFNSRTTSRTSNFTPSEDPLSAIKKDGDEISSSI
nr:CLL_HP1_G0004440.mRNA.1.CDS.1 [Saccharomyces cerevisiae]